MRRRRVDAVIVQQRAKGFARRKLSAEASVAGLRMALSMLDLTTLEGSDTPQKVRSLCSRAIRPYSATIDPPLPSVAAICVYPALVGVAKQALAGSSVRLASVAGGFPSGQYPIEVRLNDVRRAIAAGAQEIDMVINRGAFLAGRFDVVAEEIRQVKQACAGLGCDDVPLKIILETGELETCDNIRRASDLAIEAAIGASRARDPQDGEIFIKTSTGKVSPAATIGAVLVMLGAIRDHYLATGMRIGMKPAGGIRTAAQALPYLVMVKETLGEDWLTPRLLRFGASSLIDDLVRRIVAYEMTKSGEAKTSLMRDPTPPEAR